jgi:hypothetical protein
MSRERRSLAQLVEDLKSEGLVAGALVEQAGALIEQLRSAQPWYVRTMVGFGAWLASLFLIGFVAGLGMAVGGLTVVGIGLIVVAVLLRRRSDNDFMIQSTLATSLAGQATLAFGLAEALPGNDMKVVFGIVVVMSSVLFFIFPDRIHRVLSVLFFASALTMLVYAFELNAAVPFLGPAFAAGLVLVYRNRARITANGQGHLVRPLENGLMLSAFGCLLLSTIYVLPDIGNDFVFYPRPWASTLLLGALFLYVGSLCLPALLQGAGKAAPLVYGLMIAVIACAWGAPGLLLALTVVLLGTAAGNWSFVGAGIVFLVVFVGAHFYGIEMTMLTKSATLTASGAVVLLARWLLLKVLATSGDAELQRG